MISLDEHIENCEELKRIKKELIKYINCRCDIKKNLLLKEEDLENKITEYTDALMLEK